MASATPEKRLTLYSLLKVFLIVVAITVVTLLLRWLLVNYVHVNYSVVTESITSLNAPTFVKRILLFVVGYNVYLFLCACFGASVGAAEILSRYKDEPFIAIISPPGQRYLGLNALISLAAFYVLYHFHQTILIDDPLTMSIVAGFGAMVIMRSKLFNFKTEKGETYAVGPDAVLSTFLSSVDRQIDRYRASRRQALVYEETQSVIDPQNAPEFLKTFLVSYQNLSNDERGFVDSEIKRIYEGTDFKSPRLKFMVIAFGFLNIMGEKNFKALIDQLKKYQTPTSTSDHAPAPATPATPPATETNAPAAALPNSPVTTAPVTAATAGTTSPPSVNPSTSGAAPPAASGDGHGDTGP